MSESRQRSVNQGVRFLEIDVDSSGQRLDNYLTRVLKGVPRTRLYRALRKVKAMSGELEALLEGL